MKNLKIGEISSSGQKQGENTKIGKFPRESGRLGSYVYPFTATKYKCKIRSRSKIEYCIENHPFKIINMLLTN